MELEPELPLEVQLRLARWKLEIEDENLSIEGLRMLYMSLAKEFAQKEVIFRAFIKQLSESEKRCNHLLEDVEKKCESCQQRLSQLLVSDNSQ